MQNKHKVWLLCLTGIFIACIEAKITLAQNKPFTIAVLDFKAEGTPEKEAQKEAIILSGMIRTYTYYFANTNEFLKKHYKEYQILDQEKVNDFIFRKNIDLSAITTDPQLILLGKLLEIDGIIYGTVKRNERKRTIEAKFVDVNNEKTEVITDTFEYNFTDSEKNNAWQVIQNITQNLFPESKGGSGNKTNEDQPDRIPHPSYSWKDKLIPGNIRRIHGDVWEGNLITALQIVTIEEFFRSSIKFMIQNRKCSDAKDEYMKERNITLNVLFSNWQNEYKKAENIKLYSYFFFTVAVAVFGFNLVDSHRLSNTSRQARSFEIEPLQRGDVSGIRATMRF